MCRNIRVLFNFEPPATEEEIHAAALQYVRKVSGAQKPSRANEQAFNQAVGDLVLLTTDLLEALSTDAPPKNRDAERDKARERNRRRFAST